MNKEEQVKIENLMINLNNLTEENLNRFCIGWLKESQSHKQNKKKGRKWK